MDIGIVKETREGERRVAVTADAVKSYKAMGARVLVEAGAGRMAAVTDAALAAAGAEVVEGAAACLAADLVLKVQRPSAEELAQLKPGAVLVGQLEPHADRALLDGYAAKGVTAMAMELLPRSTRAQAMDVLSSQANLAGYRAVIDAMAAFARPMPMMMTAAGTVAPARVFVIGAGVAGLQAIATAKRMGAVVSATDVRAASREEVMSLGAKFVGFVPADAATSGGYARPLTPEEQAEQARLVAEHLKGQDIVITTAQIPGRAAPRIVTAAMVASLKPGSVVLDLAAESGGNVEGTVAGQTVETDGGVSLVGPRDMLSRLAPAASQLYAKNLANFVRLIVDTAGALAIPQDDDIVTAVMLTHGGHVVHSRFTAPEA